MLDLDRIAPNSVIPLIDRGYFRIRLGFVFGSLVRHSSWLRGFLDAANSRAEGYGE